MITLMVDLHTQNLESFVVRQHTLEHNMNELYGVIYGQ